MPGRLFTDYFLSGGIQVTSEWLLSVAAPGEFEAFRDGVRERYESVSGYSEPNEAVTERDLIWPVLELLGWADYLPQQGTMGNEEIPDLLLFPDADSKERAVAKASAEQRYPDGVAVGESKRFGLPLDARDGERLRASRTPHGQMLRYLSTAEIESDGRVRWGMLTSGDVWRLYYSRARPRATGYFEVDLGSVLGAGDEDALRVFYLLFRRESFVLRDGARTTFLQSALDEGRRYEERVAADLSVTVFEKVFPSLVGALADESGEELSTVSGGGADLSVPAPVYLVRGGQGAAAGQRPEVRRLRSAKAGARRHSSQDGTRHGVLVCGVQVLRPPDDALRAD